MTNATVIENAEQYDALVEEIEVSTDNAHGRFDALLEALDMEPWDYENVYLVVDEMGEPGYPQGEFVVTGNWNPKRFPRDEEPPLTFRESIMTLLFDTFESWGIECHWCDEWSQCCDCGKLYRTEPDSYSWKPSMQVIECDYVCHECIKADEGLLETVLEEAVNNHRFAFTYLEPSDMIGMGFEEVGSRFQNGWHDGMTDDPEKILKTLLDQNKDAEVVFLLDRNSQFHIEFSAWIRNNNNGEENE